MDKQALLKRYSDNLANSKRRNHYLSAAADFLEESEGLDRESIDKYIEHLRRKYKPGTVNFRFRVIRRLFAVNQLPWEYLRGEAPIIRERDEHRPQLGPQIIGKMILAGRYGKLAEDEVLFVALSTTYGLRREEMANLRPEDVDLKHGALYVATAKFGRERYHLIPKEILPYLKAHDFSVRYGLATISIIFHRVLLKAAAGELKVSDIGWHAIRRALFDGLVRNGVDPLAARKFLRWKSATGDMAMPARYYGNVVIDIGTTAPVLNEAQSDAEIFERHPFLPFWLSI